MDERRQETRKKVMAFTLVYDAQKKILLGYVGDLTMQGTMVVGEKCLEVGGQLILDIELPGDLPGIQAKRMTIPARVARCSAEGSPGSFSIGFEFTDVGPESARIIQALLERYHFRHQI